MLLQTAGCGGRRKRQVDRRSGDLAATCSTRPETGLQPRSSPAATCSALRPCRAQPCSRPGRACSKTRLLIGLQPAGASRKPHAARPETASTDAPFPAFFRFVRRRSARLIGGMICKLRTELLFLLSIKHSEEMKGGSSFSERGTTCVVSFHEFREIMAHRRADRAGCNAAAPGRLRLCVARHAESASSGAG